MSDPLDPERNAPATRRSRVWGWIVLGLGAAFLALVVFVTLFPPFRGGQEPLGPVIQNDTLETIRVFTVDATGGAEFFIIHIPAGQSRMYSGDCRSELVLRDEAGYLIERRGPFEGCNLDTWVIQGPFGGTFR